MDGIAADERRPVGASAGGDARRAATEAPRTVRAPGIAPHATRVAGRHRPAAIPASGEALAPLPRAAAASAAGATCAAARRGTAVSATEASTTTAAHGKAAAPQQASTDTTDTTACRVRPVDDASAPRLVCRAHAIERPIAVAVERRGAVSHFLRQ